MNSGSILIEVEDLKTYIESGLLELYVLGDVSRDERLQVEGMADVHPAVKAELNDIEKALELYAGYNAVEPNDHQRNKILNSLVTNLADDDTFKSNKQETPDNIIAIPARTTNFYKYAFAASIALLLVSVVALFNVYNKLQQSNTQLLALSSQNEHYSKTVNLKDEQLSIFRDPNYKMLRLKGMPKNPSAGMTVAWNPEKKKVMIDMNNMQLPANDQNHQYQLWALVKGKPVDLGVFDKTDADSTDMRSMKSIASADAFAVTLEPRGGSVNPTMDQMMVIGKF